MVREEKKRFVQQLAKTIQESPLVGVINMQNLPAPQLQKMRAMLAKQHVTIIMARKRLLSRAMKESRKENIEGIITMLRGLPALLFSSQNPFALYATIQKNKSEAQAKAGQIAPKEVIVKAGMTNFAPGPIISELASAGVKTKVESGKLAIINDVTVAREGDVISAKLAETLKRLDIKPMEIGLDLVAVLENGIVFGAKQLHIDEAEYLQKFSTAARWAISLAIEAAYFVPDTTELLLQKAFREAKGLALAQDILTDMTAAEIVAKAERQAAALKEAAKVETASRSAETASHKEDSHKKNEDTTERKDVKGKKVPEESNAVPEAEKESKTQPHTKGQSILNPRFTLEAAGHAHQQSTAPQEETPEEEEKAEEPAVPEPTEEPTPRREARAECPVKESKREQEKVPSAYELAEAVRKAAGRNVPSVLPQENIQVDIPEIQQGEPNLQGKPHPKQGDVSVAQAEDLLTQLQKKGTLRK